MKITAMKLPESRRLNFLPYMFGSSMMRGEALLYSYATKLAPDEYRGGLWDFYKLSNNGGYAAPTTPERYNLAVQGNGFEGEMSNDAAGIVITMFVLNQLAHELAARGNNELAERLSDRYHELRDYAGQHAERASIFRAID
ncbi:antirestriction protein [Paraburkholderia sp. IW21]|uniref:antirestriction protein n=1 Tax=Paraburkholderia sp. IW21 TaxID=3242488 RepID=UPI0035229748